MTMPQHFAGTAAPHTIPALLAAAAQRYDEKPFLVEENSCISYSAAWETVQYAASGLLTEGFKAGDRAAIWCPNISEWVLAALAIQLAGGTLVTLNTRYKGHEAAQILTDSGATHLFCIDAFLGVDYPAVAAANAPTSLKQIIVFRAKSAPSAGQHWSDLVAAGASMTDSARQEHINTAQRGIDADTPSDILFTSGTTGRAKGVVTGHGQNIEAFTRFADILGIDEQDRYLIINPFFHSFGYKAGWLSCLIKGAAVYPQLTFDVDEVLTKIARDKITVMPGPPTLFQSLLAHPDINRFDISTLTKATTGAATIPTSLIVAIRERLGISNIITAYGLSESCGLVSMCRPGDDADIIAHTSGRAIPNVELAIMGAAGELLAAGETGEIVVRGFNVMQCYLDNPEATADSIDQQGWLHTGDIGHLDIGGNLSITDRLKDMFISGGFNCYPAEIENALLDYQDIAQCAVIGVPHERMGEVGAAFVVVRAEREISRDSLALWCREHMANYKVPKYFYFVDSLPLNDSGKVLKTQLRDDHTLLTNNATATAI